LFHFIKQVLAVGDIINRLCSAFLFHINLSFVLLLRLMCLA